MKTIIITLLLLAALAAPAFAQDDAPLVFFGRGLYLMDEATGEVEVWNECGNTSRPRISPTGEWIAQALVNNGIRLCNLYTREVVDVALPTGVDENASSGWPAWSPDGAQVAWTVSSEDTAALAVYDLENEESRLLVEELPEMRYPAQVLWGESGILVVVDRRSGLIAPLYSAEGELLVEDFAVGATFMIFFWVTDSEGNEYLGRYQNYWMGDIIEPETGIPLLVDGIELYSPLAPEGLSVALDMESPNWIAYLPDGGMVKINSLAPYLDDFIPYFQFDPHNIGISPDGEAFAIFDLDQVLWRDGETTPLPDELPAADGTGVIWGPMAHRITGEIYSAAG